jgi:hypothetical protein
MYGARWDIATAIEPKTHGASAVFAFTVCQGNKNRYSIATENHPEDRHEGAEMTSKGIIKSAQESVVTVAKSVAEEAKAFAGEVADAGAAAAGAATAAAVVVLDKVATAIEARAAKRAKAISGETATTAAPSIVLDKVARAKEARQASSRAKKRVAKRAAAKKHTAPKQKASTKMASRKAAKKKRI